MVGSGVVAIRPRIFVVGGRETQRPSLTAVLGAGGITVSIEQKALLRATAHYDYQLPLPGTHLQLLDAGPSTHGAGVGAVVGGLVAGTTGAVAGAAIGNRRSFSMVATYGDGRLVFEVDLDGYQFLAAHGHLNPVSPPPTHPLVPKVRARSFASRLVSGCLTMGVLTIGLILFVAMCGDSDDEAHPSSPEVSHATTRARKPIPASSWTPNELVRGWIAAGVVSRLDCQRRPAIAVVGAVFPKLAKDKKEEVARNLLKECRCERPKLKEVSLMASLAGEVADEFNHELTGHSRQIETACRSMEFPNCLLALPFARSGGGWRLAVLAAVDLAGLIGEMLTEASDLIVYAVG